MAKKDDQFVASLKKAKGLGAAHEGVDHWLGQRITAITNLVLVLWLVFSIVGLQGASYAEFTAWLSQPVNAILMVLTILSTFYHAKLGTEVITEDYVSCKCRKWAMLIALKIGFFVLAVACIISVLKIAFAAGI